MMLRYAALRCCPRRQLTTTCALAIKTASRGISSTELSFKSNNYDFKKLFLYAGVAGSFVYTLLNDNLAVSADAEPSAPGVRPGMSVYSRAEVAKHNSLYTGVWTTFGNGVYDITKFIENHPGGAEKAQLAAGGQLENYWNLYRQHYNSPTPKKLLGQMCIGVLDPKDVAELHKTRDASDPYSEDPEMSPVLRQHQEKPANAEAPGPLLAHSWLTPTSVFFIRNHHPVPVVKGTDTEYMVDIQIGDGQVASISLQDIKTKFKKHEVVATLQCGGNRREEMSLIESTAGTPWRIGAMSNARWEGAYLSDVLRHMGMRNASIREKEGDLDEGDCGQDDYDRVGLGHVQFEGIDSMCASVLTGKVMQREGDVLLAYRMNGEDIPGFHGYPLRVIVPGVTGTRSVKHLKKITVAAVESYGPWQRGMAYKGFNPSLKSTVGIDVSKIPSLQEQPVQSAITTPIPGASIHVGEPHTISGYAYSGGGRGIIRVDVSIDGGETWTSANLTEGSEQKMHRAWAWTFWECDIDILKHILNHSYAVGEDSTSMEIICKAVDAAHNVQPDTVKGIWNLRGINNNAWHRIKVNAVKPTEEDS